MRGVSRITACSQLNAPRSDAMHFTVVSWQVVPRKMVPRQVVSRQGFHLHANLETWPCGRATASLIQPAGRNDSNRRHHQAQDRPRQRAVRHPAHRDQSEVQPVLPAVLRLWQFQDTAQGNQAPVWPDT